MTARVAVRSRFGWLIAERFLRLLLTVPVAMVVARSLGPADLGRLGVALGIAGIAMLTAQLGLDRFLRRDLVERPREAGKIVATAAILNLGAALLAAMAATGYAWWSTPDTVTRHLVLILAWAGIPQVLAPAEHWFLNVGHPRPVVATRLGVLAVCAGLRLIACASDASVSIFAVVTLVEWGVGSLSIFVLFHRRQDRTGRLCVERGVLSGWLREGWPAILMMVGGAAFERIDLLALHHLASAEATGNYVAAQRFSELWWGLSVTVAMAVTPWLTGLRLRDRPAYRAALQRYFDASMAATLLVATGATVLAPWLIPRLIGPEFTTAGLLLVVLCWTAPAVYSEMVRSQHLLLERKVHLDVICNLVNLVLTLALCCWLIPQLGALGAAVARACGYVVVVWILPWAFPGLRDVARLQWRAFGFFRRLHTLWPLLPKPMRSHPLVLPAAQLPVATSESAAR